MGKPKIFDGGRFYSLTKHGPSIDKGKGTGKVLTELLDHPGQWYSQGDIQDISGWKKPGKAMREFSLEVNAWMGSSYKIEHFDIGGVRCYRLVEVKKRN